MRVSKRSFIMLVGICIPLFVVGVLLWSNGEGHQPASVTAPTSSVEPDPAAQHQPAFVLHRPTSLEQTGHTATLSFKTDSTEPQVLWQDGQRKIVVQDLQLRYTSDGTDMQILYEWKGALPSEAWLNGEYLLIGTQLSERVDGEEGYPSHGAWLAIHFAAKPVVTVLDNTYFGPHNLLSVALATEPPLFFVKWRNGSGITEYVYDPSQGKWKTIQSGGMHASELGTPMDTPETYLLSDVNVYQLPQDFTVYSFMDHEGVKVYYRNPYYFMGYYPSYELLDIKLVPFLEGGSSWMGLFRQGSGEPGMSFLGDDLELLPMDVRLWQEDWQALNRRIFTHKSTDKLEVIQFKEGDHDKGIAAQPQYTQFSTNGGKEISAHGSLLEYEFHGETRTLSWYDLVNNEGAKPEEVWSSPLKSVADITLKKADRPLWDAGSSTHSIIAAAFEEYNTNAPIPEKLHQAMNDAHREEDYSYSKTYRKLGSQWFVLVNRNLYAYKAGELAAIGELPITLSNVIGEAVLSLGARDFIRLQDGWMVADTEASRVIKLNDKLEVQAELSVPHPYRLTLEGKQLQIDGMAQSWTTDTDLKERHVRPQKFLSTRTMKKEQVEQQFLPQEWYRDAETGLTWYPRDGRLYQYEEQKGQYRSFYLGMNENARGHVRIIPFKNEVIVLLDHRLERFDRRGNWLSTLAFPRSVPDGIYSETPEGENSLIVVKSSGLHYLVQGFRILGINLERNEVETVFRQNDADIGKLIEHQGSLYFLLHSNQLDMDSSYRDSQEASGELNTEVIRIDGGTNDIRRFSVKGFFDAMTVEGSSGDRPGIVLYSYNYH